MKLGYVGLLPDFRPEVRRRRLVIPVHVFASMPFRKIPNRSVDELLCAYLCESRVGEATVDGMHSVGSAFILSLGAHATTSARSNVEVDHEAVRFASERPREGVDP